jgi:hypothetical protein
LFYKYDDYNRPRLFVSGHNPRPQPSIDAVFRALDSARSPSEIAKIIDKSVSCATTILSKMKKAGLVSNPERGKWARVPVAMDGNL